MMLYPSMSDLLKKVNSRYMLVNIVARRARQIADMAEENDAVLEKKPVSYAIAEVAEGKLSVRLGAAAAAETE